MGRTTGIEWCDATWNPIRGCTRVSAGCVNCYAERQAARFAGPGGPYEGTIDTHGRWNGVIKLVPQHLDDPLRWQTPLRIFVNSMSDLFHENLPIEYLDRMFAVMALAERHTFLCLTKRPERMRAYMRDQSQPRRDSRGEAVLQLARTHHLPPEIIDGRPWPPPNVWLIVSAEDQETVDARVPLLLDTPAAVRGVSLEPLIGPVTLRPRPRRDQCIYCGLNADAHHDHPGGYRTRGLDWVIVGGESGPHHRPMASRWVRRLRHECQQTGTAFFFKQWGGPTPKANGRILDGVVWSEYPAPLTAS